MSNKNVIPAPPIMLKNLSQGDTIEFISGLTNINLIVQTMLDDEGLPIVGVSSSPPKKNESHTLSSRLNDHRLNGILLGSTHIVPVEGEYYINEEEQKTIQDCEQKVRHEGFIYNEPTTTGLMIRTLSDDAEFTPSFFPVNTNKYPIKLRSQNYL